MTLESLVRLIREISTAGGVSPTAASVLARLGREGPTQVSELARATGVSQPAMTQLVTRMERDALVARTAAEDDRRVVLVGLAERGKQVLDERRAERAGVLDALLDELEADDQAAIAAALPALERLVDASASH
ncbi:MarR family transcriptional regulator [Nocardioides sp. DS6]|uniref:MarR family transcriptional regulator n=1 Tax=Nocardioides eburneus TaxID=3231482 RepID=A0ABV3SX15_9ACTN